MISRLKTILMLLVILEFNLKNTPTMIFIIVEDFIFILSFEN